MKKKQAKCKKNNQVVAPVPPVELEARSWNVNCPKCGTTLKLKESDTAYLCPVCSSVLRVKTGARLVKNLNYGARQMHVCITDMAANYILWQAAQPKKKKGCCLFRKKQKPLATIQDVLANAMKEGYTNEDSFLVDVCETGLFVKKTEPNKEQ
jgi:Zn finger protein HypA/HybF involved in hydrogenase expression